MSKFEPTDPVFREAVAMNRVCTCGPGNTPCAYCKSSGYHGPKSGGRDDVVAIIIILLVLAMVGAIAFVVMYAVMYQGQ